MTTLWAGGGSYQAWADYLEGWATGRTDGPPPPALDPEDLPADTWQRLLVRIGEAVSLRLQNWADAMITAVSTAPDEFSAGRALAQSRVGLREVRALASHPSLPEDFSKRLLKAVDQRTQNLQSAIETELDGAVAKGQDPRWVEARRRTVRDNRLTAVLDDDARAPAAEAPHVWSYDPAAGRRRVIGD
ncbi:hypothetical protein QR77_31700 [Streptomyces sp. 150FB]|uniref:hypothetical protein n=1 Tax=Streptomyces sp. 150FB TaxID=1576605 RepID=UPI0005895AB9|nr:hypothetical protein [Streptomyces sp. 150FB]KIF77196.1 hypothetical protein QR77_31700 [Streptomyces sp. 150FB]